MAGSDNDSDSGGDRSQDGDVPPAIASPPDPMASRWSPRPLVPANRPRPDPTEGLTRWR
jgi:hypothetical protein